MLAVFVSKLIRLPGNCLRSIKVVLICFSFDFLIKMLKYINLPHFCSVLLTDNCIFSWYFTLRTRILGTRVYYVGRNL